MDNVARKIRDLFFDREKKTYLQKKIKKIKKIKEVH